MTTLETIGFTLAGGSVVFVISTLLFGLAVRQRCIYVAPRCTGRPRDVIYNPRPSHSSQDRGGAMLGWIKWTLGLTYPTMLEGVPGTGTRKGGMEGQNLKVQMDGIVLLRFHATCLRVALLATVLCVFVILPVNLTARCIGDDINAKLACSSNLYNLTNYERTTLANIPSLGLEPNKTSTYNGEHLNTNTLWGKDIGGLLGRMYGIALCSWAITLYACYTIRREWVDILAMRRVYYLETDIWEMRKQELRETLLKNDSEDGENANLSPAKRREKRKLDPRKNRDVWIPDPEQRETVPNVALYSVLVGSLPNLPAQVVDEDDVEMAVKFSKRQSIDWQLGVATAFFDQCVPNQPGFSSSVAAVTILPDAPAIAEAWKKWYAHAGALRRLRFIRRLISDLRHYDIEDEEDEPSERGMEVEANGHMQEATTTNEEEVQSPRAIYKDSTRNADYYREVLGAYHDEEVEDLFLIHLEFGPEQIAIYSRELAQSAAQCCPNGCGERRLRRARIDELLVVQQDALVRVEETYKDLQEARDKVASRQDEAHLGVTDFLDQQDPSSRMDSFPLDLKAESQALKKFNENSLGLGIDPVNSSGLAVDTGNPVDPFSSDHSSIFPALSSVGVRRRGNDQASQWAQVEHIVNDGDWEGLRKLKGRHASLGTWTLPSCKDLGASLKKVPAKIGKWACTKTTDVVDEYARESTYAVVTFTSRQAAVAARHCLTDGRGQMRWVGEKNVPVPPLADGGACDFLTCRNCCRPITLSIPDKQKLIRRIVAVCLLATIYIFYTIPLTFASNLANPQNLERWLPLDDLQEDYDQIYNLISGLIVALIWTLFFSVCPVMFKAISNFGSNATSVVAAEYRALQYFWWFMLVTAFSGNLLSTMVINGLDVATSGEITIGTEAQRVLIEIASTIPTQIAATWMNWIIVRFTITLPLNYMLQVNTFLFSCLGWNCCKRLVMGGGPGSPVPYRIYVDSGVAFLCVVALAPASPLVAPCALLYFLYAQPLMRRNLIFMYRPKFDGGGIRWPFLSDVMVSSLLVGQVLLTTMLALKQAFGPAVVAALPFIPTILHRHYNRERFFRAFMDAALLQTSNLDMWDNTEPTSLEKREEFRRFLVDAHKAAYVPVCIAGRDDGRKTLTAEPAVVIPHPNDVTEDSSSNGYTEDDMVPVEEKLDDPESELLGLVQGVQQPRNDLQNLRKDASQYGASLRRVSMSTPTNSIAHRHLAFNDDGSVSTLFGRRLGSVRGGSVRGASPAFRMGAASPAYRMGSAPM